MTGGIGHGAAPAPPVERVGTARLVLTLGGAGALAGALIVIAFQATSPPIEAHRARRLDAAIAEVLKGPARYDTLFVVQGALHAAPPRGPTRRPWNGSIPTVTPPQLSICRATIQTPSTVWRTGRWSRLCRRWLFR